MGVDAQMLVKVSLPDITTAMVRRWAYELASAMGGTGLNVVRPGRFTWMPEGRHCLEIVEKYIQDGKPIWPQPGQTLIEVHLSTRYYSEDYPRGDLPAILAIARWLKARVPTSIVFYGGDSSGICAEEFTEKRMTQLWNHWVTDGWRPYWDRAPSGPACEFCAAPMWHAGGGNNVEIYNCDGCKLSIEVDRRDGKITERQDRAS